MRILKITSNNARDLYADFKCTCPSERFKGTDIEDIMKTTITLRGYDDDYFFNITHFDITDSRVQVLARTLDICTENGKCTV